jgi:hypothetical protein
MTTPIPAQGAGRIRKQPHDVIGDDAQGGRGAAAYRQAYEYVAAGGRYRTRWGRHRAAMAYLLLTASPSLTPEEEASARAAAGRMARYLLGVTRIAPPEGEQ